MNSIPDQYPRKIISGGQTGVDRAALDIALELHLPCGGWCPAGRSAEDGTIPDRYPLRETPSDDPALRTESNVRDTDGTLILTLTSPTGGTAFAIQCSESHQKPYLIINPGDQDSLESVQQWIRQYRIGALNIAGPRESESPGIYRQAKCFLQLLLAENTETSTGLESSP